jgi:7-cyano-7-deazaguanine synthase in queuosine biosynthesis
MNNCLTCGHDLVNIIYGTPSAKLVEMAKNDDIALGGKKNKLFAPTHYCYGCNETFIF